MNLHPILPGGWCVPSAIQCLTGADYESVIHPAINRHATRLRRETPDLLDLVVGTDVEYVARAVLEEMGCDVRQYRGIVIPLHSQIRTWAKYSLEKYHSRALLVTVRGHALVIKDGRVYDTHAPHGAPGDEHPHARCRVTWCALVERH